MEQPSRKIISHLTMLDNQVKARDLKGVSETLTLIESYVSLATNAEPGLAVRNGVFFRVASALDSKNWSNTNLQLDRHVEAVTRMQESGQLMCTQLQFHFLFYHDARMQFITDLSKINSCVDSCMHRPLFNGPGEGIPQFEELRRTIEDRREEFLALDRRLNNRPRDREE